MTALPQFMSELASEPRVRVRRQEPPRPDGRCVVYWMQRAQRALDNPALDMAVRIGNELGLPVVVYLSIIATYPGANWRHYHFLGQGLAQIGEDLAARGIGFVVRRGQEHTLESFLEEVQAAFLVGDENPCHEPERWRAALARKVKLPYWTVDADVLVPTSHFNKHFYLLHHFRPHLYKHVEEALGESGNVRPVKAWKHPRGLTSYPLAEDITTGMRTLDRSTQPVDDFTGGPHAALQRLRTFIEHGLASYDEQRNHPETDGTSKLSPYLHFGHISPLTIVRAVDKAVVAGAVTANAREVFVDELVGWRELAINFVQHVPVYETIECAPDWARQTLLKHAADPRPALYTLEDLENARTHDELWNAAQLQMTRSGWMHNYMRMYWAKKILEWTPNPVQAYTFAVLLNDRYQLDGRDPNGYAGIAWAIAGVHDRPWFERPVFGTIRYMSGTSAAKKFNARLYISQYSQ